MILCTNFLISDISDIEFISSYLNYEVNKKFLTQYFLYLKK